MGAVNDSAILALFGAGAFIYLGWACWLLANEKWKKFWIGWMIFWFLPIAFRVLSILYLGS